MKFSTKSRYGLRAMIELAVNFKKGPVPVKVIAGHQGISEAYLEQLMSALTRSKLTKSIRGAQGGYLLAKEPSKIKVGEIIRALEGPIVPVECVDRDDPAECDRYDRCASRMVWEKVRDAVESTLDSITLQDLKEKVESMEEK